MESEGLHLLSPDTSVGASAQRQRPRGFHYKYRTVGLSLFLPHAHTGPRDFHHRQSDPLASCSFL